ncbi:MAG: bifunctional diaminohydroxyphosphoribosylaminopyrimidine deaminase/5-amino-6-(5-phosphoribosylamino)uracil reductase RibD [Eubacteriales bacterium]|nr:bifunctional diaminohydroxyphosphoribosylaminopyrimidine deaminase/5-amino-6-(5-phosphoribosylamino)uracil reductase RibD [Eubacteriales bacterium]
MQKRNTVRPQDEEYMREAIRLAKKGGGYTNPNPKVGAVIVKNGSVIGSGYHERCGTLHAERNALASCKEDPTGATLYVTLEPCCHFGKTPPCTEAVIASGITRVVAGSSDPNPLVAGKGFEKLREAGIEVVSGVLEDECEAINRAFFKHFRTGLPYVTLKYAMTLDGKIATATGESQWITGTKARVDVHKRRAENMAILTGIGTVLRDDPELTVRDAKGISPIRVICDTNLRTPLDSTVMKTAAYDEKAVTKTGTVFVSGSEYRVPRTIIATAVTDSEKLKPYQDLGAVIINTSKDANGHVDMTELMKKLGDMNIDSIWTEAGGRLLWSLAEAGLADAAAAYIAPMILGGEKALSPVAGTGFEHLSQALKLTHATARALGKDLLVTGEIKKNPSEADKTTADDDAESAKQAEKPEEGSAEDTEREAE